MKQGLLFNELDFWFIYIGTREITVDKVPATITDRLYPTGKQAIHHY